MLPFEYKLFCVLFSGFLGMILASFIGNIAYRKSMFSVLKGFSHCESCQKQLSAKQLFPVVGWIINKGKCPHCKYKIPFAYPVFEVMMFFLGGLLGLQILVNGVNIIFIVLFLILSYLSIYDLLFYEIDEKVVNLMTVVGFVFFIGRLSTNYDFPYVVNGLFIFFLWGCYFLITKFSKITLMGMGDFRFFTMLLLFIPFQLFWASFWGAAIIGGIVSVMVIILNSKNWRGKKIPYIPLFFAGVVLASYFGWDNVVQEWINVLILYKYIN